jgi:predicted alpha/beta hydrolase
MRKSGPDVPPGYDPAQVADAKPKTKAAKRNERRKEKRQQVAVLCLVLVLVSPWMRGKPSDLVGLDWSS